MIADDVLAFIRASIRSVWSLELLVLMQSDSGTPWRTDRLVRELRASASVIAAGLAELGAAGLVADEGGGLYRFRPRTERLAELTARLVAAYSEMPMTVTNAILSAPNDKIQTFADAFLFKKK